MRNSLKKKLIRSIKVTHISYSDYIGGAAIASKNINDCIRKKINSSILVFDKKNEKKKLIKKLILFLRIIIGKLPKIFSIKNFSKTQSFALIPSRFPQLINRNKNKFSITNLHWVNRETLSIEDIYKIKTKIVWSCHDMWPFSGSYHLYRKNVSNYNSFKFKDKFLNFDYWTWQRKKKLFNKKKIYFIAPSRWIRDQALRNKVIKKENITVIGNPIDCKFWKKTNKNLCYEKLNIEKNLKYIVFGGNNIVNDKNKGFDLAVDIFNLLKKKNKFNFKVLFFGSNYIDKKNIEFSFKNFGIVEDKKILRQIYSISEVCLITSKTESFCQVAAETQSCSTPVIAFKTSGLNDVVKNDYSGYLISKYKSELFADKISKLINDKKKILKMSNNAQNFINKNYNFEIISNKYINFYLKVIND